jgi:hypothetical protein
MKLQQLINEAKNRKSKLSSIAQIIHTSINDVLLMPDCSSLHHILYTIYKNPVSTDLLILLQEYIIHDTRYHLEKKIKLSNKLDDLIAIQRKAEYKDESSPIKSVHINDIIDYFLF